jgi:hypothetical protein
MIHPPAPDALDRNPELASLCLFATAAIVARSALICVHPALRDLSDASPEQADPRAALSVALGLVALADGVEELADAYLRALERERLADLRASQQRSF